MLGRPLVRRVPLREAILVRRRRRCDARPGRGRRDGHGLRTTVAFLEIVEPIVLVLVVTVEFVVTVELVVTSEFVVLVIERLGEVRVVGQFLVVGLLVLVLVVVSFLAVDLIVEHLVEHLVVAFDVVVLRPQHLVVHRVHPAIALVGICGGHRGPAEHPSVAPARTAAQHPEAGAAVIALRDVLPATGRHRNEDDQPGQREGDDAQRRRQGWHGGSSCSVGRMRAMAHRSDHGAGCGSPSSR